MRAKGRRKEGRKARINGTDGEHAACARTATRPGSLLREGAWGLALRKIECGNTRCMESQTKDCPARRPGGINRGRRPRRGLLARGICLLACLRFLASLLASAMPPLSLGVSISHPPHHCNPDITLPPAAHLTLWTILHVWHPTECGGQGVGGVVLLRSEAFMIFPLTPMRQAAASCLLFKCAGFMTPRAWRRVWCSV